MPYKTIEEIKDMVGKDKDISSKNHKINRYLSPWIDGRNFFDGNVFPKQEKYKEIAESYNHILFNTEE